MPVLLLILAARATEPLERGAARPSLRPKQLVRFGGNDLLGMVGGLRAVVAGGFWLRAYQAWERQDGAATTSFVRLTVAADERPLYFWLNGARMLAYDMPAWTDISDLPEAARRQAAGVAVANACSFLEEGCRVHPVAPELVIEMATIQLRVGGDREKAAELFRRAAEMPNAPYYAARIHGELLRELGRPREALAWLRELLPTLPASDPAACRGVVEQRIKALEAELGEK